MADELVSMGGDGGKKDPIRGIFSADFIDGTFLNPKCKLCRSPFRKEAERMHDNGSAMDAIKAFLDGNGEALSIPSISVHMKSHYRSMEQMVTLLDYCDRLEELREKRLTRKNDIDLGIRVCYLELARAIALQTSGDISKEKIRTELILKVNGAMLDNVRVYNEMEKQDDAVKAIEMRFAQAWRTCIETSEPGQKQLYAQALREFQKILEDTK